MKFCFFVSVLFLHVSLQRLLKHCQVKCDISIICHFSCKGNFTWRFSHLLDGSQGWTLRGMPGVIPPTFTVHAVKTTNTKSSDFSCLVGDIPSVTRIHSKSKSTVQRLSRIHFWKSCLSSTWQVYIASKFMRVVGWSSDEKGIKCCTTN